MDITEFAPINFWELQNDGLNRSLSLTHTGHLYIPQEVQQSFSNPCGTAVNNQEQFPLNIGWFNSWDYIPIWDWDIQISKWCIWNSANALHLPPTNSLFRDDNHTQENGRFNRINLWKYEDWDSNNHIALDIHNLWGFNSLNKNI